MLRRRKTSVLEELIELSARLPWWVGVALGVLSYVLLHAVAETPSSAPKASNELTHFALTRLWQTFAFAGQFLFPFVFAVGAVLSVARRRKRTALVDSATDNDSADALQRMTWQEFELLVGEGFRRRGYVVSETGGGGADGGVDLVLTKSGEKVFVQCKHWKAFRVGVAVLRELYGAMAASGAAAGIVVTSGRFTDEAKAFASGRNISLLDGPELLRLLREASAERPTMAAWQQHNAPSSATRVEDPPLCPLCTKPMVRRVARRGRSSGKVFWGCPDYPRCKGTKPLLPSADRGVPPFADTSR